MFTISNYTIDSQKFSVISLVPGEEIFVEIHDGKFFMMTDKDLTIPKIRRKLDVGVGHEYWFNVAAEYVHLLDRPEQRCEDSWDYSFTQCVEVSPGEVKKRTPPKCINFSPCLKTCTSFRPGYHRYQRHDMISSDDVRFVR